MTEIIHVIRQIMNGTRLINNRNKYEVLGYGIAIVHFFYAVTFLYNSVFVLGIYNIMAVLFYLYVALVLSRKERYIAIYVSSFIEILLCASLSTFLLGWQWGFMFYTVSMVSVAFYLSYTLPGLERRMSPPIFVSIAVAINYMVADTVMRQMEPIYEKTFDERLINFFHGFNTIVAFVILLFFSMLFALEVRYMQYQLERENYKLSAIANYDPLTRLLNRRSMTEIMRDLFGRVKKTQEKFCLVMIDIDDFKKVNDTYGHAVGDQVLLMVSELISKSVREEDFVCRWGGEEILLLLMAEVSNAQGTAERIRKDIVDSVVMEKGNEIRVSVTMGVAEYHEDVTIRELIDEADEKLYYGKRHGKNQVVV